MTGIRSKYKSLAKQEKYIRIDMDDTLDNATRERKLAESYYGKVRCGTSELWFVCGEDKAGCRWFTNRLVIANIKSGIDLRDVEWRSWWQEDCPRGVERDYIGESIIGGSGSELLLFGGSRKRQSDGKAKIVGGRDRVVLSFHFEYDESGDFCLSFTDKMGRGPKRLVKVDRQMWLEYRFKRPSPLLAIYKHDVICRYGILDDDKETLWMLWKLQQKFLKEKRTDRLYFVAGFPIESSVDVSTIV